MILVPTEAADVLPGPPPDRGGPEAAWEACGHLRAVGVLLAEFRAQLDHAEQGLLGDRARSVDAVRDHIRGRLHPGAQELGEWVAGGVLACAAYADRVGSLARAAAELRRETEEGLAAIRSAAAVVAWMRLRHGLPGADAWDAPPPVLMPAPAIGDAGPSAFAPVERTQDAEEWAAAVTAWRDAVTRIEATRDGWSLLRHEREDAESDLARALRSSTLGEALHGVGARGVQARIATALVGGDAAEAGAASAGSHPLLASVLGAADPRSLWDRPPAPETLAAWWDARSGREREALIAAVPGVLGNLPGLPVAVRDRANRSVLRALERDPSRLGSAGRATLDALLVALRAEQREIAAHGRADPPLRIVALDLEGSVPRLALAVGDPDTAAYVSWGVPGMRNDADRALPAWDRASRAVFGAQREFLTRHGEGHRGVAVIAWLAADTPDTIGVLSASSAQAAAPRLAAELDGMSVARAPHAASLVHSVFAHSYGTTVAAAALARTRYPVHSAVLIGSAGLDGTRLASTSQLRVELNAARTPRVFTAMARRDGLAPIGSGLSARLQPNPEAAWSRQASLGGAYAFSVEGIGVLRDTDGHSLLGEHGLPLPWDASPGRGYLDPGTQSLASVAALLSARPDRVPGGLRLTEPRAPSVVLDGKVPRLGGRR